MSVCTVENLSHSYAGKTIFTDVSFRLLKGEHVGLIGANGEGKSTFLKIITHTIEPDFGKITWSKNCQVGYLNQQSDFAEDVEVVDVLKSAFDPLLKMEERINELYSMMADMTEQKMNDALEEIGNLQEHMDHHDFYLIDAKVEEIANALGINAIGLHRRFKECSGGQRTKVLLAKLLLEKPDILLLDEPTNYLDEEHIDWLKRYLLNYENAFILISHDRFFINDVVNIVYHVSGASINRYVGNVDEFERVYEIEQKALESAFNRQQKEIEKMEDFIARNKARVATRGMANSRAKKLDKIERIVLKEERDKPTFHFLLGKTPSKTIFECDNVVIGYTHPLSKPMNLVLEKGKKIAIIGANGLGKSTLLKSLLGLIETIDGKVYTGDNLEVAYFQQEVKPSNNTCIDELWLDYPSFSQYEIRSALAKCGLTTNEIESKVHVLSGGEQAKLRLCKLMNKPSNVLLLDEPTNHLDSDSKDELKRALIDYKGTILLVCHEKEFYQGLVDEIWNVSEYSIV